MSKNVYHVFRKKGFVTFNTFNRAVRHLRFDNPRGVALTLLACHGSIERALALLEERAEEDHPARAMVQGLQRHTRKVWGRLHADHGSGSVSMQDITRWRTSTEPAQVTGDQLAEMRDLFLDLSRVVECMHLLANRLVPEREGEDWNRFITPFLLFSYLLDTDDLLPFESKVEPRVATVSDEALNQLLGPLPFQRN